MTEQGHGRRTFFHARGANALWQGDDLDFKKLNCASFTWATCCCWTHWTSRTPSSAPRRRGCWPRRRRAGVKTSVDVVSEDSDRFASIVNPALRHVDYCILNEIEAGKTTGFKIRQPGGQLDTVALRHAAGALLQQGVRELVVVHFPEGAFARTRKGEDFWQPSFKLPPEYIAGTAGAGDAFCAGVLSACTRAGTCSVACSPACASLRRRWRTPRAPRASNR